MSLAATATQAHSEIKNQIEIRRQSYKAADDVFRAATHDHYRALDALEARYGDVAFQIACDQGKPPFTPHGQRQQPTTLTIEAEGVLLIWDNDDRNYVCHLVTWKEIEDQLLTTEADT